MTIRSKNASVILLAGLGMVLYGTSSLEAGTMEFFHGDVLTAAGDPVLFHVNVAICLLAGAGCLIAAVRRGRS
ncbi:MAG: hypothetical protein QNJ94_04180 [Alphaproteobacteria bacterium]|nr:hypothetical protein [Alphaproteobacteria bacterium]